MTILGIDPGIGRVGYGLLQQQGSRLSVIKYGCLETPKSDDRGWRLGLIKTDLKKIIDEYGPSVVGIEKLYFQKNIKTASAVSEARGVIMLLASESGARIIELGPGEIKQALTGYGSADKKQIQQMVKIIFKLDKIPKPDDAADALAVAYTAAVLS